MTNVPSISLHDGVQMPQLGFGVFQVPDDGAHAAVAAALQTGYRSIDTAKIYRNEAGVGRAIAESGLSRSDLFVTTKLWLDDLSREGVTPALEASLERLGLDAVDLYLIHWPAPATDAYLAAWEGMQEIAELGLSRSIGVSNFLPEHLDRIAALGGATPTVNQIELHPALANRASVEADERYNIATEAWSPLGQGAALTDPVITEIAQAHGVTPAQVVIRWHLQQGRIVIPKSVTPSRIDENFDVFGFTLTDADLTAIDGLDRDARTGPNPAEFNG